jgi:ATP-dependent RNA circularization protein (DNA/RNA ligase family)
MSGEEADAFLSMPLVLEEKVDGANLGISIDSDGELRVQNRGSYLDPPFVGQFSGLERWLDVRQDELFDALGAELMLFGEWCAVRHSLGYDRLPDWFVAFDVYDRAAGRFWSAHRRNDLAAKLALATVPAIDAGRFTVAALVDLVTATTSSFRDGPLEGLYLRKDEGDWLVDRAKLVRSEFVQAIGEHWRDRAMERNWLVE